MAGTGNKYSERSPAATISVSGTSLQLPSRLPLQNWRIVSSSTCLSVARGLFIVWHDVSPPSLSMNRIKPILIGIACTRNQWPDNRYYAHSASRLKLMHASSVVENKIFNFDFHLCPRFWWLISWHFLCSHLKSIARKTLADARPDQITTTF